MIERYLILIPLYSNLILTCRQRKLRLRAPNKQPRDQNQSKNKHMDAKDLAREVVAYTQPRDRLSPLVLVVFCRSWRGRDVRNENNTMRITAPIENGCLILRIIFPTPNYAPTLGHNVQNNVRLEERTLERTVLDYDGTNNLEGAASCIEGHMSYRDNHDIMLFNLLSSGDLGPNPLSRWSLSFEVERGNHTTSRLQIIQQILRSLLLR